MSGRGRLLPALAALVAAAWLGAVALFGAVVAPAAFAVLPERAMAGALVGRVLPALYLGGIVVGALVAVAGWSRAVRARRVVLGAGLLTALACAYAHVIIGARMERLRASLPGALDELGAADPRRVTFGRLHGLSVAYLGLAAASAAAGAALLLRGSGERTRV